MVDLVPEGAYEGIKHLIEGGEQTLVGEMEPVEIGPWIAMQNLLRSTQPARPGE